SRGRRRASRSVRGGRNAPGCAHEVRYDAPLAATTQKPKSPAEGRPFMRHMLLRWTRSSSSLPDEATLVEIAELLGDLGETLSLVEDGDDERIVVAYTAHRLYVRPYNNFADYDPAELTRI